MHRFQQAVSIVLGGFAQYLQRNLRYEDLIGDVCELLLALRQNISRQAGSQGLHPS